MTFLVPATAYCPKCGVMLSWPIDAEDETVISCLHCGKDCGTYGELKDGAATAVASKIDALFKSGTSS